MESPKRHYFYGISSNRPRRNTQNRHNWQNLIQNTPLSLKETPLSSPSTNPTQYSYIRSAIIPFKSPKFCCKSASEAPCERRQSKQDTPTTWLQPAQTGATAETMNQVESVEYPDDPAKHKYMYQVYPKGVTTDCPKQPGKPFKISL